MNCEACTRKTRGGKCAAFTQPIENCWAYTEDPECLKKVNAEVKRYTRYKNGYITPYWGQAYED